MNDLVFAIIGSIVVWAYVIYCLVNGRKTKVVTTTNRYNWVILLTVLLALGIVLIIKPSINNIIFAVVLCLAYTVYSIIPSGYDEFGIYVKGRYYPLKKIEDIKVEYLNKIVRLNFKYRGRIMYLDVNEENSNLLINLEHLYKEGRNI